MQIERQDLSERLRDFPLGNLHQKSLKDLSKAVQKDFGRRKVLIVYEGMEEAVVLMRTILPA